MSEFDRAIELACLVLSLDVKDFRDSESLETTLNNKLMEEYGTDLYHFQKLINRLLVFTPIQISPLTGIEYNAFIHKGVAIYKKEIEL